MRPVDFFWTPLPPTHFNFKASISEFGRPGTPKRSKTRTLAKTLAYASGCMPLDKEEILVERDSYKLIQ